MKPHYEHVHLNPGESWRLYVNRADRLPFLWHYHPEFELTLITNAKGHRYVGNSIESFDDGDLVLIGPNQPHSWSAPHGLDTRQSVKAVVVWFSSRWIVEAMAHWPELGALEKLRSQAYRGIRFSAPIARAVRQRIEDMEQQSPLTRLGTLLQVLGELTADPDAQMLSSHMHVAPTPRAERRLGDVLQTIHADIKDTPGIDQLADIAALSTGGFQRFFKRHVGMTVLDYIQQTRVATACQLLIASDAPIGTIAGEVGYRNLASFNRQFLHCKAITPSQFRRLHRH